MATATTTTTMVEVSNIQATKNGTSHIEAKSTSISVTTETSMELEKDIISESDGSDKKNGLNGSSNGSENGHNSTEKLNTLKKRVSSSKTPNRTTREMTKAKRVRFFRNGDKFWSGILVAISNERYK